MKEERLTNLIDGEYKTVEPYKSVQKLGIYEDIEELCNKLLEQNCYYKKLGSEIIRVDAEQIRRVSYDFNEKLFAVEYFWMTAYLHLSTYGIDWALTKEELE